MKEKQIMQITPLILDGFLLISLDSKWIEVFNGVPSFDVVLDKDGKLHLISVLKAGKKNE